MFNKIYDKNNKKIKSFIITIFILLALLITNFIELPYYIEMSGGVINLENRITIDNSYESSGSLNMSYVSSLKANIPFYLIALINKDWDLVKIEDEIAPNETEEENEIRNKILLSESKDEAIILAYNKALKNIDIISNDIYVTYIYEMADTNLKIGDKIVKIDDKNITSLNELKEYINTKEINDKVKIHVINKDKEEVREAKIIMVDGNKIIGIMISDKYEYVTNPKIEFKTNSSESGPSGGLMISLAVYNKLIKEDITKGRKIAGTGTIDIDGNVGSISGVKYKLKGAVKEKCDIFLVPSGENYEEAMKIKKENNYNIKILDVSTFDEALEKLANN